MSSVKFKIESGLQLFARLTKKSDNANFYPILFPSSPKQGDIVELYGKSPSSALLLIDLISETLIPSNISSGICGGSVLIIKTDGKLNLEECLNNLRQKLIARMDENSESNVDNLLHNILNNLLVQEVFDATQFYTTLHNLDNILLEHRNISLIVIDTLTAFYWSEQGFRVTKMDLYIKRILKIIQNMIKEYEAICIFTRPEYFSSNKDLGNVDNKELITDGVKYRIQVSDTSTTGTQVNIRTTDTQLEKYFIIINNEIKWQ